MSDSARANIGRAIPRVMRALAALDAEVTEQASALDPRLVDLVKIRTSQINGCAYCLRLHTREALEHGEPAERLAVLPAWRETEYFSAQERAALALAEAVTLVSEGQVPDEVYEQAALHLSDAQIAAVSWVAVVINSFNRVAITSRYPVAPGAP